MTVELEILAQFQEHLKFNNPKTVGMPKLGLSGIQTAILVSIAFAWPVVHKSRTNQSMNRDENSAQDV